MSDCEDITDEHLDGIRTLDLSGQGITALQAKDFDGLIWVRSVDLSDNSLTDLPDDGGLGGLSTWRFKICGVDYELRGYSCNADGSYNGNNVRAFVYGGHSWLNRLDLSNNRFTTLPVGVFSGFYQLGRLDLSGNLLTSLPKEFWFETRNLVSLDLSGNNLTNLKDGTFRYMVVYSEGTLKTLDLSDNGLLHAPRELWDDDCNPRVVNLTTLRGNPDLQSCVLVERFPSQDFNTLKDAENKAPEGIWSDGVTIWVADFDDRKLYAYNLSTKARDSDKDIDVSADFSFPYAPFGIWADGTTMWVTDTNNDTLLAYKLTPAADLGTRDSGKDIALTSDNTGPFGIWADGTTMWVTDGADGKLYAYNLSTKARDSDKDIALTSDNVSVKGMWSDGTTMWVAHNTRLKLYAFNLSTKAHDSAKDIALTSDNFSATGIWSDGETMWVADFNQANIFAYSISARFFQ